MQNNTFLIPANSKKSLLIFGMFDSIDAIMFGVGIGISFLLMMILPNGKSFALSVISIMPAFVTGFLVFPIPNYHNVRTVIDNAWKFYTTRQRYIWKGWCFDNGEGDKK